MTHTLCCIPCTGLPPECWKKEYGGKKKLKATIIESKLLALHVVNLDLVLSTSFGSSSVATIDLEYRARDKPCSLPSVTPKQKQSNIKITIIPKLSSLMSFVIVFILAERTGLSS